MIVAVAAHPESRQVERFGHDFPVVLFEFEGEAVREKGTIPPQAGCCRTLVNQLEGASILICTGLGQGAARHLREREIGVALVPEGVELTDALEALSRQVLQGSEAVASSCCGGGHGHDHASHGGCGCGGHGHDHHEEPAEAHAGGGCGCGSHGGHGHGAGGGCGCN